MITTDAHVLRCARGLGAHSKRWPLGRHAISVPEKAECMWEMERILEEWLDDTSHDDILCAILENSNVIFIVHVHINSV